MKQVNLRIYQTILPLLFGLFLSLGAFAQQVSVKVTCPKIALHSNNYKKCTSYD